jgi:hypothetical protein
MRYITDLLQHPLTKGLNLDDPQTTLLRRQILQQKSFLRKCYEEWYSLILQELPSIDGSILEIGTGAGFLKSLLPDLITSDLMLLKGNDLTCDACNLPIQNNVLRAIILINVLHHINNPKEFFINAHNIMKLFGKIILIEPWVSPWSRIIYGNFHHEPFEPDTESWILPDSGPLSGGNDALPWILFERDRKQFTNETGFDVLSINKMMPFRYLMSGGISLRYTVPSMLFIPLKYLEKSIPEPIMSKIAMFAIISLGKVRK